MPRAEADNRLEQLLEAMTLEEKIGQMTLVSAGWVVTGPKVSGDYMAAIKAGRIGAISNLWGPEETLEVQRVAVEETRLGIPLLFAFDVIHGHRTIFPIPLAEAAAFDPELWEQTARAAAAEAAADGLTLAFAPMLDVARDSRWGRIAESPGEDPWLASRYAEAKVRGFQGRDLSSADSVAACAKHFVAYSPVMAGREYAPVDISERTLREVHLPGFAAAVRAGVAAMMPAFTDLNGVPMTAHFPLLRDWLRGEMGFDGVIISDYHAIAELINHGVAADLADAAVLALKAGVDIDMMSDAYRNGLPIALAQGRVTIDEIDACVRRVLRLKEQLGLFDDPYRRGATPEPAAVVAERHALARDVARRAIVMLKNERDTLPLPAAAKALCVVGPPLQHPSFHNVVTLAFAQMLAASGLTVVVIIGGLLGAEYAPQPSWATVPLSLAIVSTALTTVPAAMLMRRVGRRSGFIMGALLGVFGGLVAALAVVQRNFALLCTGTMLIGSSAALGIGAQPRKSLVRLVPQPKVICTRPRKCR